MVILFHCGLSNLGKISSQLTKKLRETIQRKAPSYDLDLILTLDKLNGRWIGEKEISQLMHHHLFGGNNVKKPKWLRFINGRNALQVI